MKEAIILAGGLGTRLAKTVQDRQKVMAPVGGRPFLAYVLKDIQKKGFSKAVLAVSYHSEQIREYFGDEYEGIKLVYSKEKEPLGTGGAIKQALEFCCEDYVTVINGDTFFDIDPEKLYSMIKEKNACVVLGAKFMPDCTRHSTLSIEEDGRISCFSEKKKQKEGYINGGVYVISRNVFDNITEKRFSFERDILEKMSDGLYAFRDDGYFTDMGIPEAYFRAHTEIPLYFGENVFKAAFLDRDGVICKEKHHLYKCEDFEFIDGVPEALESLRQQGYLLIVITNQAGVAKGLYTENDVIKLHEYMCGLLSDITRIEAIYYCPFHEEGSVKEYRLSSPDRKPSDGMIRRALDDFRQKGIIIDLESSILIGDKLSDIRAGIKAGIGKNFLVRSGHSLPEDISEADGVFESIKDIKI